MPKDGCRFVERCPLRIGVCADRTPGLVEAAPGHAARCHVTAPATELREVIDVEPIQ
jgi:peptide/nickel transport system ATP-binding protein